MVNWLRKQYHRFIRNTIIGAESIDIKDGKRVKQTGRVILGKGVYIGEGVLIARGKDKNNPTIVESGVVIAPGVSLGHSCHVKKNSILLGKSQISGWCVIGENSIVGPHSSVKNRITLFPNSILGQGSVLTKDLPEGEVWVGNPARFLETVEERNIKRREKLQNK